jgi:nicotinamidase-related amidase
MKRVDLFVIDGENDFCASGNEPDSWPQPAGGKRMGALFVPGADQEAVNVANMIKRLRDPKHIGGHKINKLHATLDSHHLNDGSHNTAWKGPDGSSPPPFTVVSHDDVRYQKWVPRFSIGVWDGKSISSLEWALNYTKALETQGRSPLILWPPHCLIQSWGCNVYHPLQEAFDDWCQATGAWVNWITKGQWPWTEHYSGLRADVPDSTQPATQLNAGVIQDAANADIIAWAGWAGSHCLRWTALDAINYFGTTGTNDFIKKCVFFEDASAAVADPPGGPKFSEWRQQFLDEVSSRGATVTKTTEFLK